MVGCVRDGVAGSHAPADRGVSQTECYCQHMDAPETRSSADSGAPAPTALAALSASLIVGLGMLELLSWEFWTVSNPASVALAVAIQAVFLGVSVAYLPTRLAGALGRDFDGMTAACLGDGVATVVCRVIGPLWVASWLSWNASVAVTLLTFTPIGRMGQAHPRAMSWIALVILTLLVVPAANGPTAKLANLSVWMLKVSSAAVLGLAIGFSRFVPELVGRTSGNQGAPTDGIDPRVLSAGPLIWSIPPVLLIAGMAGHQGIGRGSALRFACLGGALPLTLATLASVITIAGAANVVSFVSNVPHYLSAVASKGQIAWIQVLVLLLSMLMACRFALHLLGRLFAESRRFITCSVILLIAGTATPWFELWEVTARTWQYCAATFASLAGVFCAAHTTRSKGTFDSRDRGFALAAWILGSALIATQPVLDSERPAGYPMLVVIVGWLIAFLMTLAARLLNRTKRTESVPQPAP